MDNVSRPLIALLLGTVAFFAVWMVALKPSSSSSGGSGTSTGVGQYQSAIDKARQAVGTSNAASQAHGGTVATTPATSSTPTHASTTPAASSTTPAASTTAGTHGAATTSTAATSTAATQTPATRLSTVEEALSKHKVVALLFYNPSGADDQAVRQELNAVPSHGGSVVKLAVPVGELSSYSVVSTQVPVNQSPTLVLIDRSEHASEIVGFADSFEIAQRVSDALATP